MATQPIFTDASWLPHRLDLPRRALEFVRIPRETHSRLTFLDDAYIGKAEATAIPLSALAQLRPVPGARLTFIFHSAFCCSTLLARALDVPGVAMPLKEPAILNAAAALKRDGQDPTSLLGPLLTLLERPFTGNEAIVIKPSNVVNILIDPLMRHRPFAKALLLYAPLPDFLISVAKKGMWGRIWARRLYRQLEREPGFEPGYSQTDLFEQTDLQIAALGWLQQQAQFAAIVERLRGRVRTLRSDVLLGHKASILARLADFFALPFSAAQVGAIVDGAAFAHHSKRIGSDYGDRAREAESAQAKTAHGAEIAMVVKWAETIGDQFGIPMTLGSPLL